MTKDQRTCKACGRPVDGKKQHCNNACKQRAYRQRKKLKIQAEGQAIGDCKSKPA
jgi:predicted nucleic acid-binding Zn ribbon protein